MSQFDVNVEQRISAKGERVTVTMAVVKVTVDGSRLISAAEGNGPEAVERLNALLIQHPVHPEISGHDGQPWHLHLTQGGGAAGRYAAGSAMGLAIALTQLGADRLGVCAAPSCQGVFIDASTNRSRRYCGERCAARANVTALRARGRPGPPDVLPTAAV